MQVATDMGYFEPQERRTAQITARVPKTVETGLRDLARAWTILEQAKTKDPDAEVSVTDVVVRLLQVGLDGAWSEAGAHPETEEQWAEFAERATKVLNSKKK